MPATLCNKPCDVYSRVVGYLSPRKFWNPGKKAEGEDRLEYEVPTETEEVRSKIEQTTVEATDG